MDYPSFDDLRYLNSWRSLTERYDNDIALKWLIIWQALNKWDIEIWPKALVFAFGSVVESVLPDLLNNPPALDQLEDTRWKVILDDNFPERLKDYCEQIKKVYKWWSLYDP